MEPWPTRGGVVDAHALRLDGLEELPHGPVVDGPAELLLHPLVDLLEGEFPGLGAVLVGGELHHVVAQEAGEAHLLGYGGRRAPTLASDEGGDPLHYVALSQGIEEEHPLGVAVGVDEAGQRLEAVRVYGADGITLHVTNCDDLVSLDADGTLILFLPRSVDDRGVLD